MCSSPWGLPESLRKERVGQGGDGGDDSEMLRVTLSLLHPVLPSFEVQLTPNKTFFYLNDEALGVNIQAR